MNIEDCEFYREMQHILQANGSVKDIAKACLKDMVTESCESKNCCYKKFQTDIDKLSLTRNKLLSDLQIAEESLKDYKEHYNKLETENEKLKNAIKEIKTGAIYGSANSQHFLHNIFEDIIKICNEAVK